jgi:hypothetical protein
MNVTRSVLRYTLKHCLELAKETFSSVTNIGDVFDMANDEERRRLMMYIGSNWYLTNKKVVLTPREPLSMLRQSTVKTNWRAIESDFRTIFHRSL